LFVVLYKFSDLCLAIDEEERLNLPLQKQLEIMLVRLDHAVLRAKKTKKLRAEIAMLKRFVTQLFVVRFKVFVL